MTRRLLKVTVGVVLIEEGEGGLREVRAQPVDVQAADWEEFVGGGFDQALAGLLEDGDGADSS